MTLNASSLTKTYEGYQLGPIDLHLKPGEVVGLLGANGAGKSTLMQLLTASLEPTAGEVRFGGQALTPAGFVLKRQIGYLPQNLRFPKWVTARELLLYAEALFERPGATRLQSEKWDLGDFLDRPISLCSHGMQKRVGLALATMNDPLVLLLDEPFSGLDLYHIRRLVELLGARKEQTTLLSTHVFPYAVDYCQRALILQNGKLRVGFDQSLQSREERLRILEAAFFPKASPT